MKQKQKGDVSKSNYLKIKEKAWQAFGTFR